MKEVYDRPHKQPPPASNSPFENGDCCALRNIRVGKMDVKMD